MGKRISKRRKTRTNGKQYKEHEQEQEQGRNGSQENELVREHEQDQTQTTRYQGEDHEQLSECIDEFSSFIKRNIDNLIDFMTTQFGLLEVLESNNVLTSKQVSIIQDIKDSNLGQVRKLLEEMTKQSNSTEKKKAFLRGLDQSLQKHVSNIPIWGRLTSTFMYRFRETRYTKIENN